MTQADELIKIAEYSKKAGEVKEIELQDENSDTGMAAAENLYTTNPEIKVFLSAHNGLALGIHNYYTGIGSPVTDSQFSNILFFQSAPDKEFILFQGGRHELPNVTFQNCQTIPPPKQ